MVEEFEKLFIKYTIAEIKRANNSVESMIITLGANNPALADYAASIADSVKIKDAKRLGREFQAEIIKVCKASDNPQETAQAFFAALKLTPAQVKEISRNMGMK
ncbi:Uncharacterised protein [uncultured archaeon]|nr:Uncharacterised protein [uncultured archaeon]